MQIPYERAPLILSVTPGVDNWFEFPFPGRATITRIAAMPAANAGPALTGFSLSLYNKKDAVTDLSLSTVSPEPAGIIHPEIYRVTPVITSSNGSIFYFADEHGGYGFDYCNLDNDPTETAIGKVRKIYVKITATGAGPGPTKLVLTIAGRTESW